MFRNLEVRTALALLFIVFNVNLIVYTIYSQDGKKWQVTFSRSVRPTKQERKWWPEASDLQEPTNTDQYLNFNSHHAMYFVYDIIINK